MGVEVWKLWPARVLKTGHQPEPVYVLHTLNPRMIVSLTEDEALALAEKIMVAVDDDGLVPA